MFRRIKNKALMAGAVLLAVFLLSGCSANKVTTSTNQGVQGQMSNSNTIEEQQKNPSDDKTTEQKAVETGVLSEELIKKEKTGAGKKGVWYGELRQFSMSGSMKFYYKDNVSREKLKMVIALGFGRACQMTKLNMLALMGMRPLE